MKITDIKKVDPSKLKNAKLKEFYKTLADGTDNFNPDFIELYEEQIITYLEKIKEFEPDALEVKIVKKRTPKPPKEKPIDFEDEDVVETVMDDYNLTREKAIKLIALRKEAYELKKENLDKLLDRLDKSEFYKGKLSKSPIDKGRTRNLGKDSKQGSITLAEERKMTGTPFKRISKAGRKNQYGTTEGNNVYYEYRQNRRDVDNKIRLAKGGGVGIRNTEIYRVWSDALLKYVTIQGQENLDKLHKELKKIEITSFPKKITYDPIKEKEIFLKYESKIMAKGGGVEIPNAEKMFHLPYELAVYVPSTKDVDKNITASELRARVKEVEKYLAETFGGFTSAEKVGGYLSSKSSVITEKVIPVTAFATRDSFRENKSKLINKMSVWAKMWGQEAIGFEFEGDLYYVPQKFKKGGKLTATYIPKYDIKTLTTVWGNNIKGKDLIDGAYTTRKDIRKQPKMVRSIFEEEEFSEFAKGGGVGKKNSKYELEKLSNLAYQLQNTEDSWIAKNHSKFVEMQNEYKKQFKKVYGHTNYQDPNEFAKGGKTKKPKTVRYYFEDEAFEYAKGGSPENPMSSLKYGVKVIEIIGERRNEVVVAMFKEKFERDAYLRKKEERLEERIIGTRKEVPNYDYQLIPINPY